MTTKVGKPGPNRQKGKAQGQSKNKRGICQVEEIKGEKERLETWD